MSDVIMCSVAMLSCGHAVLSGDLVCGACSQGRLLISEFRAYGPVRACSQCCFGQEEVSVRRPEHVMDLLRRAEEYTRASRDKVRVGV